MRKFRLKPKAGTTAQDTSAVVIRIHGGLPRPLPTGDSEAQADTEAYAQALATYKGVRNAVRRSVFKGRKVVVRGGLPDAEWSRDYPYRQVQTDATPAPQAQVSPSPQSIAEIPS